MDKVINMNELIGAAAGDRQHMLGKFLYFSLTNLLVDKDELYCLPVSTRQVPERLMVPLPEPSQESKRFAPQ